MFRRHIRPGALQNPRPAVDHADVRAGDCGPAALRARRARGGRASRGAVRVQADEFRSHATGAVFPPYAWTRGCVRRRFPGLQSSLVNCRSLMLRRLRRAPAPPIANSHWRARRRPQSCGGPGKAENWPPEAITPSSSLLLACLRLFTILDRLAPFNHPEG
jgi:hypothetical protein